MKRVTLPLDENGRPIFAFLMDNKDDGSFHVEAIFSDDGRLIELFIWTENGDIDKDRAADAVAAGRSFHKMSQIDLDGLSEFKGLPPSPPSSPRPSPPPPLAPNPKDSDDRQGQLDL